MPHGKMYGPTGFGKPRIRQVAIVCMAAVMIAALIAFPPRFSAGGSPMEWPAEPPQSMPELSDKEWEKLRNGDPVTRDETFDNPGGERAGRGVSYILISAPPEKIWEQILGYDRYVEFYPNVNASKLYHREGDQYFARFTLSIIGIIKVTYHVHHTYRPKDNCVTWETDHSRPNDIRETKGFWKVWPLEDGCMVGYSIYVDSGRKIPGFVEKMATGYGLRKVTSTMKKRVESGGTYTR